MDRDSLASCLDMPNQQQKYPQKGAALVANAASTSLQSQHANFILYMYVLYLRIRNLFTCLPPTLHVQGFLRLLLRGIMQLQIQRKKEKDSNSVSKKIERQPRTRIRKREETLPHLKNANTKTLQLPPGVYSACFCSFSIFINGLLLR